MSSDPTELIREADRALDGITPGPWSTVASGCGQVAVVNAETRFFIALLHPDDQGTEVGESNIRLIAAAPDLVRRLRDALATALDDTHTLADGYRAEHDRALRLAIRAAGADEVLAQRDEARAALAEANATIERLRAREDAVAEASYRTGQLDAQEDQP